MAKGEGFHCASCGQWHEGLPRDWVFDAPLFWYQLSEQERVENGYLEAPFCRITHPDQTDYFIQGFLEMPVADLNDKLVWTAWTTLSENNWNRARELWNSPERANEEPYFGWFSNHLAPYPNTVNLKTKVTLGHPGHLPQIHLQESEHPLSIEHHQGISKERLREIAAVMMHHTNNSPSREKTRGH